MEKKSEGTPAIVLLVLMQGVLASGAVEVQPSMNPAVTGDTVTFSLCPTMSLNSGSWAVGDTDILTWRGTNQAVFSSHRGRASVNVLTGALTLSSVTMADSGVYAVQSSDLQLKANTSFTVLDGPDNMVLTVNGQNTTSFLIGSNLTMFCSKQSNPPAQLQWAFRGELLNTTGPLLELYSVSEDQSGSYSCLAFNNQTNMDSNITTHILIGKSLLSGCEHHAANEWLLPVLSLAGFFFSLPSKL